jgi:hypothetical protein
MDEPDHIANAERAAAQRVDEATELIRRAETLLTRATQLLSESASLTRLVSNANRLN